MNSYKHTINHAYSALTNLVTEMGKATTDNLFTVVMEHWKTLCLIFDQSLQHTANFIFAKSFDSKHSAIKKAIKLDLKCLAKRLEGKKARLARCMELQASLEALLS